MITWQRAETLIRRQVLPICLLTSAKPNSESNQRQRRFLPITDIIWFSLLHLNIMMCMTRRLQKRKICSSFLTVTDVCLLCAPTLQPRLQESRQQSRWASFLTELRIREAPSEMMRLSATRDRESFRRWESNLSATAAPRRTLRLSRFRLRLC